LAGTASSNTIVFGSMNSGATGCSLSGNAADRSCSHSGSVTNGALDNAASLQVVGQASADHGLTTNATAIADIAVQYDIPYTITRTVTITQANFVGDIVYAVVPTQQILFNATVSGEVSKDNSQVGGGLGQAFASNITLSSLGGRFSSVSYSGGISQTGGGGLARTPFTITTPDPSWTTNPNSSGPAAGEISFAFQVPTDYRLWQDLSAPLAYVYGQGPYTVTQSLTDTLRVTFRLRAESRPSGSISTTGGEGLACMGQTSPLGGFDLDNAANCGSGFKVDATVTQTGTTSTQVAIPEPASLALLGGGAAGLLWAATRRRRD
jgi:hypothetical protein